MEDNTQIDTQIDTKIVGVFKLNGTKTNLTVSLDGVYNNDSVDKITNDPNIMGKVVETYFPRNGGATSKYSGGKKSRRKKNAKKKIKSKSMRIYN